LIKPSSSLVSLLLRTRRVRVIGRRLIRTYLTALPDGTSLRVRTGDISEEQMIDEIYGRHVYETEFPLVQVNIVVDAGANIGVFSLKASRIVGAKVGGRQELDE